MALGDHKLDELMAQAKAAFDALTPEEKAAHRREQYISFAYGNLALSNREVSREQVEAQVDAMIAKGTINLNRPEDYPPPRTVWERLLDTIK